VSGVNEPKLLLAQYFDEPWQVLVLIGMGEQLDALVLI
jgi:hypothetical protein